MNITENSIEALVESTSWDQIVDLITQNIADAGLFENEDEEEAALAMLPDDEYKEVPSIRQCLAFLRRVLENVAGCDSTPLIRKLIESPIIHTVRYLQHVLGQFQSSWCSEMVISDGINTNWSEYLDAVDVEKISSES